MSRSISYLIDNEKPEIVRSAEREARLILEKMNKSSTADFSTFLFYPLESQGLTLFEQPFRAIE